MHDLVLINWQDAHGGNISGWKEVDFAASHAPVGVSTVGYILSRDDRVTVVAPHILWDDAANALFCDGEIAIPTSWIDEIWLLEPDCVLDDEPMEGE